MAKVQFPTSVKYRRVKYPAHTPFTVDDSDLALLVYQGAIVVEKGVERVEKPEENVNSAVSPLTYLKGEFSDYTVVQLREYADANGVTLPKTGPKEEIVTLLNAVKAKRTMLAE